MKQRLSDRTKIRLEIAALGFAVLVLLASWFYRDDLFRTLNDPGTPFQTYEPPIAPDYALRESWLALPDLDLDPELSAGKGDVFVVAPTLFLGGKDWVASTTEPKLRAKFDRIATPNYVTPYASAGRVYAPRYRQASLYSFLTNRDDARAAQQFAYLDVRRAFRVFLDNHPPERPIVLVGHGQGGLHVQRLIQEFFSDARAKHLAAAYIIDHPTPLDILPEGLAPCQAEMSVNCVISFGAFTPKDEKAAEQFVTKTLVFESGKLSPVNGRALLCVNPLLWSVATDYAPARLHKGGVAAEGLTQEAQPPVAAKQAGAQCEDGVLLIDKPKQKSLRRPSRFGGRYRTLPSNLFYEDLRQNMALRVGALIATDTLPRRAPILEDETLEIIDTPVTLPEE